MAGESLSFLNIFIIWVHKLFSNGNGDDIMIQKISKSLLFILFGCVLFLQHTASAHEADWGSAPHFSDQQEFIQYIIECNKNLQSEIAVVFDDMNVDEDELFDIAPIWAGNITLVNYDGRDSYVTGSFTHTPGERVAYAYLNGDTSFLEDDEIQLYNEAVDIVNEANAQPTLLRTELLLHDILADRITYFTEPTVAYLAPYSAASGAILDGQANCQGYSDAFIMLARMCGIEANRINGYAGGGRHTWSVVYLDGNSYFVDVTFDDASFHMNDIDFTDHIYFNVPKDVISGSHSWDWAVEPPGLQEYPDENYYYTTSEYDRTHGKYFGMYASTAEDALQRIADNVVSNGWRFSYAMCPYDEEYNDANFSNSYLLNDLLPYDGWTSSMNINTCGDYMFFTTDTHH